MSFDTFSLSRNTAVSTTALTELFATLAWLGPLARSARDTLQAMLKQSSEAYSHAARDGMRKAVEAISGPATTSRSFCCADAAVREDAVSLAVGLFEGSLGRLALQDQDGTCLTLGEALLGRPSAVAFFYTRCMNPEKCSLTITKLGRLQRRLGHEGFHGKVNVAGITYDPGFDLHARLRTYGADRGMIFDRCNRLLRTTGPFEPLRQWFALGVGYGR